MERKIIFELERKLTIIFDQQMDFDQVQMIDLE